VLALTLVFGRVFCGWICPFGTLHHFFAWIFPSRYGTGGAPRRGSNKTHPVRQRVKYYLIYAFLLAALAGSAIGGSSIPSASRCARSASASSPRCNTSRRASATSRSRVGQRRAAAHDRRAQVLSSPYVWSEQAVLLPPDLAHRHVLLVAILFMNRFVPRFWCRVLCPLGAFLGVLSRFALVGMEKDHKKCTDCNLCLVHCQGADSPQGGVKWQQDECHMCMNCESACPEDVIKFRFLPSKAARSPRRPLARRTTLAAAAAGVIAVPAMRIADVIDANYDHRVIRPPGSVEEREFLERCIRCAECMKVCPNNALHPAWFEAGVEGMWTPILIPRIGYCEHSCVLCGQVCPTGAIQKITEKQKLGVGQKPISIGTAFYDQGRCLPWSMGTPCIVCEEFCPTSPKAIWVEEVEVPKRSATPGPDGQEPPMESVRCSGRTSTLRSASAAARARRSAPCRTSPPST
jgi:polyferredoxin